jgi:hypothetical protein
MRENEVRGEGGERKMKQAVIGLKSYNIITCTHFYCRYFKSYPHETKLRQF